MILCELVTNHNTKRILDFNRKVAKHILLQAHEAEEV